MAAEFVVPIILDYLVGLLITGDQPNFIAGGVVEDKVNSLQSELRLINIFLESSEGKQNDEIVKEVVRQIREVAYDAEDVIDNFILKSEEHRRRSMIGRIFHFPSHRRMLRDVEMKIVGIKGKINEIYNNKERYNRVEATVNAFEEEAIQRRRREVKEDDVVGFVHYSTTLVKHLMEGNPQLDVVSIIGMGGLGKTTLARKIYDDVRIKEHFNCCAWLHVSKDVSTRTLLLNILKQMSDECRRKPEIISVEELKEILFEFLRGKRYLVVLDDIWKIEVWNEVRHAFPENLNGSRILITSRIRKVALHASHTPPYLLPILNPDESWELFNKKVFGRKICPPELKVLGRQIVEDCCGLPLSIVVLAGILAKNEKSLHVWSKYVGHVTSFLISHDGENGTLCQKILSLSYLDLPLRLKSCFLYFSIYPDDFEIPAKQLIHMWVAEGFIYPDGFETRVAEGFIQHTRHRFLEDVAELYLEELVDRSLIQVASRRADGGVKTCRIHALLQDFCRYMSAEENFLKVCSDNNFSENKCRRLSIQGSARQYFSAGPFGPTNARSLFFLGEDTYSFDANHWTWVLEKFQLLRVLNFGRVELYSIPTRIAKLLHLRYLAIESVALRAIPASINNLLNLETLDVRGTFLPCLPKGIWKLRRLKNLYMSGPVRFPDDLDADVTALENLHVLSTVSLNQQTLSLIVKAKLPNVRKLGLWSESDESNSGAVDVLECLHLLSHLQRVKVICWSYCHHRSLFPSTINKITLRHVILGGGMSELGKLPNLQILKLQSCLISSELDVFPGTFPQLEVLKLENLMIEEWKQEGHAMPFLKNLFIKNCIKLTVLPLEVQRSAALQYVEVVCSNLELAKMIKELQIQVGFRLLVDPPLNADFYLWH